MFQLTYTFGISRFYYVTTYPRLWSSENDQVHSAIQQLLMWTMDVSNFQQFARRDIFCSMGNKVNIILQSFRIAALNYCHLEGVTVILNGILSNTWRGLIYWVIIKILLPRNEYDLVDGKSTLIKLMDLCRQATNHYLNQRRDQYLRLNMVSLGYNELSEIRIGTYFWKLSRSYILQPQRVWHSDKMHIFLLMANSRMHHLPNDTNIYTMMPYNMSPCNIPWCIDISLVVWFLDKCIWSIMIPVVECNE